MEIKFKHKVSVPYDEAKKAFVDRNGKLLKFLMPLGVKLVHHKGVRRGAITSVKIFGRKVTFKVVTYSTSKTKTTFNDILKEGNFYGIKFWSHRHFIEKSNDGTVIRDELNFTTKNKLYDSFLWLLLFDMFIWRSIKTKVFFFLNK